MRLRPAMHFFLSTSSKSDVCKRRLTSAACAAHMRWRHESSGGSASPSQNLCSCTVLGCMQVVIHHSTQEQHFQTRHAAVWNLGTYDRENAWGLQMKSQIKPSALQRLPVSLGIYCISTSKKDSRWKINMPRKSWTLGRHSQAGTCGITALLPALPM